MADKADTFRKVAERLSKMIAPQYRASPITCDTEIYGDLKLYGNDLFELVLWVTNEFGVAGDLHLSRYGPTEWPFLRLAIQLRKLIGLSPLKYESFKVLYILTAIDAKRWPDELAN
jgi:hypothetical protein